MLHHVAHALPGRLLFHTHAEAAAVWRSVTAAFPAAEAICLMPDHVHVVAPDGDLGAVMSAVTRAKNHRLGDAGALWKPHPAPEALPDDQHLRRTIRYVHLNPCRAGLAPDPLAWPWSTHRDAVGRAARPVRRPERDPERFHRWVSGDPTVAPTGTPLSAGTWGGTTWGEVVSAVSAVCRVSPRDLPHTRHARTLAVRTAWAHGVHDAGFLAEALSLHRASIYRLAATVPPRARIDRDPALHACCVAVGDPRFGPLDDGDLRRDPRWARWRGHR